MSNATCSNRLEATNATPFEVQNLKGLKKRDAKSFKYILIHRLHHLELGVRGTKIDINVCNHCLRCDVLPT